MTDRERLHKMDPERIAPNRSWAGLYRNARSWGNGDTRAQSGFAPGGCPGEAWSDVVTQGVALAYRVIEEQIRQGQRVAEQINNRSYDAEMMGRDAQELAERLVRYWGEAWRLWFGFLGTFLGGSDLARNAWQPWTVPPAAAPKQKKTTIAVEVLSVQPARVILDLRPESERRSLTVLELRAVDASKPPLTDIRFEGHPSGDVVGLLVRVPDDQPPGLYSGVVLDRDTGEPYGTLSVRIAA